VRFNWKKPQTPLPLANYRANFVHGADRSSSFPFSLVDASLGPSVAPLPSINNPPSDVHYVVKFRPGLISTLRPARGTQQASSPAAVTLEILCKKDTDRGRTNQ